MQANSELDLKPGSWYGRPERYPRTDPKKFRKGYDMIRWKHKTKKDKK